MVKRLCEVVAAASSRMVGRGPAVVVERERLPMSSRRMYSVREPGVFFVEKVKTDEGEEVETEVVIAPMRAVEVESALLSVLSARLVPKRRPAPIPAVGAVVEEM